MSLARGFLSGLSLPQALNVLSIYEMGAVRSARESRSVALVWWLGIFVTGVWFCAHGKQ